MFFFSFLSALLLSHSASGLIVPLSNFNADGPMYNVDKSSKVYVISNSPQEDLQGLQISIGAQNSNIYTLSVPQTDGSLTPLVPTEDGQTLKVNFAGSNNASGWLYINKVTSDLNVFTLKENSTIAYKSGTNVFFRMDTVAGKIPVAEQVTVGKGVVLKGFVGLPDDSSPVQFFDSAAIEDTTNFAQVELPVERFHFTSTGTVKYQISYSARQTPQIGDSGLLMTDDFPSGSYWTNEYNLTNPNNINVDMTLVPTMDRTKAYTGNVTLFYASVDPTTFPLISIAHENITSNSPITRIVIQSDGPYAIQYKLRDTTATTTVVYETSTKSSNIPHLVVSFLAAALFRL